jgi:hypothetical protein
MVTDQGPDPSFGPGDRVAVPWGLDVVEGTVVSTHGQGPERRVLVSVDLPDTEESQLVTFPIRELEEAAQVASERPPGAWLSGYRFEQAVRRVLEQLLASDPELSYLQSQAASATADSRADATLDLGGHRLIIEAKTSPSGRISRQAVDQLMTYVTRSQARHGLLVTNAPLSADALSELDEAHQRGLDIRVVQWRTPDDNPELTSVIRELLLAA